jgi:hypothetical protein
VINVADRADVAMRFRPLKLCLTHGELLLVSNLGQLFLSIDQWAAR